MTNCQDLRSFQTDCMRVRSFRDFYFFLKKIIFFFQNYVTFLFGQEIITHPIICMFIFYRNRSTNPTNERTNERKLVYSFNGYACKMTSAHYFLQLKDTEHMYILSLQKVILRKVHFRALSGYKLFSALNAFLHFPSFGFCFGDYILVVVACFEHMYLLSGLILLLSHLYLNPCESKMTTSQVRSTESNHS